MSDTDLRQAVRLALEEGVEVARREGIGLDDEFLMNVMDYMDRAGGHRPSLAMDFMAGHPTEIDFLSGKIIEYGRSHRAPTPVLESYYRLIKEGGAAK